jgi:hypothetical protein
MSTERLRNYVAAMIAVITICVVSFIAIVYREPTAIGALLGLLSTAGSWFFRGAVQTPPTDQMAPNRRR